MTVPTDLASTPSPDKGGEKIIMKPESRNAVPDAERSTKEPSLDHGQSRFGDNKKSLTSTHVLFKEISTPMKQSPAQEKASRRRYQRRNSKVASMLFPQAAMVVSIESSPLDPTASSPMLSLLSPVVPRDDYHHICPLRESPPSKLAQLKLSSSTSSIGKEPKVSCRHRRSNSFPSDELNSHQSKRQKS